MSWSYLIYVQVAYHERVPARRMWKDRSAQISDEIKKADGVFSPEDADSDVSPLFTDAVGCGLSRQCGLPNDHSQQLWNG